MTPEEKAETKMRERVTEASIQNETLTAFLARIPKLRTSDLFEYIADHDYSTLTTTLGLVNNEELTEDDLRLLISTAVFAVKDEINRRFPIPTGTPS
jgi:hypothetical protein